MATSSWQRGSMDHEGRGVGFWVQVSGLGFRVLGLGYFLRGCCMPEEALMMRKPCMF